MRRRFLQKSIAVQTILVLALFLALTAGISSAQGRGGFSKEGPASSGEFSATGSDSGRGSTLSAAQLSSMRCTPVKVTVGWMGAHSVTYYQCGADWYTRAYSGNSVTYVLTQPPSDADF